MKPAAAYTKDVSRTKGEPPAGTLAGPAENTKGRPISGTLCSAMIRQLVNLVRTRWSFRVVAFYSDRGAAHESDPVTLTAVIRNDGVRVGTVYVRFLVADSYDAAHPIFDSEYHLSANERRALRIVDIPRGEERPVTCAFVVPAESVHRHFDLRVQVWNPHRLFGGRYPWKFADTGWRGMFEVIARPSAEPAHRVFISYSWDSDAHHAWVRQFAEELERHDIPVLIDQKDLRPGADTTLFMEKAIAESKVTLLVCTANYTRKANAREPGGVGFETIISSHEYSVRTPEERSRFIPVVRDNDLPKGRKLPNYLGGALYIDMAGANWRAKPMTDLVNAIRFHLKK